MLPLRIAVLAATLVVLAACGADGPDGADGTSQPPPTTSAAPDTQPTPPDVAVPGVVSVPDLSGLTLAQARALLGDTHLEITSLPGADDKAIIVTQQPASGAEVDPGTVVVVEIGGVLTCNAPDPLAPGAGEMIISVLFECGDDVIAPTPGVGVARIIPEPDQAVDRIEWTLRSLLAGPTADEQAVGFKSAFDAATANALNGVTLTGGKLVADFNDAIIVNNMNTATGMIFFNAELKRNVFQHPEVDSVEFRFNGNCTAWSALFESDGCWVISRADWNQELAGWDEARDE